MRVLINTPVSLGSLGSLGWTNRGSRRNNQMTQTSSTTSLTPPSPPPPAYDVFLGLRDWSTVLPDAYMPRRSGTRVMSRCRHVDRDYVEPLKQVAGATTKFRIGRNDIMTMRLDGIKEGGRKMEEHFPRKKVRKQKKKMKKMRRKKGPEGGVLPVIRAKKAIIADKIPHTI